MGREEEVYIGTYPLIVGDLHTWNFIGESE